MSLDSIFGLGSMGGAAGGSGRRTTGRVAGAGQLGGSPYGQPAPAAAPAPAAPAPTTRAPLPQAPRTMAPEDPAPQEPPPSLPPMPGGIDLPPTAQMTPPDMGQPSPLLPQMPMSIASIADAPPAPGALNPNLGRRTLPMSMRALVGMAGRNY